MKLIFEATSSADRGTLAVPFALWRVVGETVKSFGPISGLTSKRAILFARAPVDVSDARTLLFSAARASVFEGRRAGRRESPKAFVSKLSAMAPDDRLPVSLVLRWLDSAVQVSGDADMGLKAVRRVERGGYDVIEYAGRSASNWGEALELMLRYIRLVNEAADFSLQVREQKAFVELRSRVPLNRAASDFQAATLAVVARASGSDRWIRSRRGSPIRSPQDLTVYRSVFDAAPLHFGAAQDAVSFDRSLLDVPMKSADPKLNAVLRRHAEHLISELPEPDYLTGKVRALLLNLLPAGKTNADYVATRLGMSRRTLTRHLEREGVTYQGSAGAGPSRARLSVSRRVTPPTSSRSPSCLVTRRRLRSLARFAAGRVKARSSTDARVGSSARVLAEHEAGLERHQHGGQQDAVRRACSWSSRTGAGCPCRPESAGTRTPRTARPHAMVRPVTSTPLPASCTPRSTDSFTVKPVLVVLLNGFHHVQAVVDAEAHAERHHGQRVHVEADAARAHQRVGHVVGADQRQQEEEAREQASGRPRSSTGRSRRTRPA